MTSWVHLFSKFTPEALLFEAAFICLMAAGYFAWLVVRKRRDGPSAEAVPSSVVKTYLNELITDAEQLRSQLFGLLESSGIAQGSIENAEAGQAAQLASMQARLEVAGESGLNQAELIHQVSALEARMKDQARAMELLMQEKSRIADELSAARAQESAPATSPAGGAPTAGTLEATEMQAKISQLESRLSEYALIEDDLANLKKLQQENAELKRRLGEPAKSAAGTPAGEFDALAPQVRASLAEAPTKNAGGGKSKEDDLLAEFEKMLND